MSRLKLAKKLQPAKKAWRSFSIKFQSKVHKLNIPKTIKTTLQRLLSAFHSLSQLIPSRRHHSLTTTMPYATSHYHVQRKNFAAIRIDDLFAETTASVSMHATNKSSSVHAQGETSRGKEVQRNNLHGESSGLNTIEDAWKVVVAKSPQLQVDQKAEDFINKVREDMRLQKERSMLEFQEMLARGS
ncbi:hypothetical protein SESBI_40937 [Sesbania bispinosa]|nr:hypothetical protein SESBI_40937 [Sesbania bispinosa]